MLRGPCPSWGSGVLLLSPDVSTPCQELPGEPGPLLWLDPRGLLRLPGAQPQVMPPGPVGDTVGRKRGFRGSPESISSCNPAWLRPSKLIAC